MIGARLHLDSLKKLGLDPQVSEQLKREVLQSKADAKDIDPYNYVPVAILERHAARLGQPNLGAVLRKALQPAKGEPPLQIPRATHHGHPAVSVGDPKTVAATLGSDARLSSNELAPYAKSLGALLKSLEQQGPVLSLTDPAGVPAEAMQAILAQNAQKLRFLPSLQEGLTPDAVQNLSRLVASKALPAHQERDQAINVDSQYRTLAESGPVKLLHEARWEGFSVKRTGPTDGATGFVVHGFAADRLLVALPKDHALLLVDATGNEVGAQLPRSNHIINGKTESVVELSRSLLERRQGEGASFTVKVLNPKGDPVLSQAVAFPPERSSLFSQEIGRGTFGYSFRSDDAVEAWRLDHGVPKGSQGKVPLGKRPRLGLQGQARDADRLVLQRNGEKFLVDDLFLLLRPPHGKVQAFGVKQGEQVATYTLKGGYQASLDEKPYERSPVSLTSSNGRSVVFDPALTAHAQARFGAGGITLTDTSGKYLGSFDPLDPAQDKNAKKS